MEANQITCPQCGLVNNYLAEACVQCGIIFVKNQLEKDSQTSRDEQKRKAIEEAEAILDKTMPPPETDAFGNDVGKKIDLPEDTIEMQIPVEKEAVVQEEPKLDENQDSEMHEIELEAIETPPESPTDAIEAEELFLSEITTAQASGAKAAEVAGTDADSPAAAEKSADTSDATAQSDSVKQDDPDQKKFESAVKQSETAPAAKIKLQENSGQEKSVKTECKAAEPIEAQSPSEEVIQPAEEAPKGQQQTQVMEALKRQRERQAKTEASNKEQAAPADAAVLAKKKLATAKAEALKKQRAAQAKAEALKKQKAAQVKALALKKQMVNQARLQVLKKQKEAQAKAEASAREIEVASAGILSAGSKGSVSNHEKLLGLLKRYKGKAIGINYDNSAEIKEAELIDANEEFFSVMVKDKKLQYSYPLKTILTIVEGREGVETGDEDQKTKFDAVIKVYPLVLFK